jgi:hypothetical protein
MYWGDEYLTDKFLSTKAYKTMRNSVFITTRNNLIAAGKSYTDA